MRDIIKKDINSVGNKQQSMALPWFLASSFLTTFFTLWTFGGSVFLLFLNELGLPKNQIGAALALFPFCGVIALGFAPLALRWGWKRTYLVCYGSRNVVMALLLLLPCVLSAAGHVAGVFLVFGVLVVFALLRALAETAYYPWEQEIIPNRVRGRIAGISTAMVAVASGLALWVAGGVIENRTGLMRFLALIAAGCVLGVSGVLAMAKVPGGSPHRDSMADGMHWAKMLQALRDLNFVAYLGGRGCVTIGVLLFTSFLPLYVKEQLGVSSRTVVGLDVVVMAGGALAGLVLGWATDHVGSRPVLMPAAAMAVLVPIGWLLLPRQISHATAWCSALYFLNGVSASGVAIAANRLLFNGVIPPEHKMAYTSIYYAWLGITGGLSPLLAGALLTACGGWKMRVGVLLVDGNSLLFLGATLFLAFGWWLYGRVRRDGSYTTRSVLRKLPLFRPLYFALVFLKHLAVTAQALIGLRRRSVKHVVGELAQN